MFGRLFRRPSPASAWRGRTVDVVKETENEYLVTLTRQGTDDVRIQILTKREFERAMKALACDRKQRTGPRTWWARA